MTEREPWFSVSIQHRCPRMAAHKSNGESLPIPCSDCYSVAVSSVRIPYRPSVRWADIGAANSQEPPDA